MKTAVIVATYRRRALFERLLRNLEAATLPGDTQILIVENGPACGVEAVCRESPLGDRLSYLYRPAGNKALALNHAITRCAADFLIFLDDDITAPNDILEAFVDAANRRGPGHFFGGGLIADADAECPPHLLPYLPRSAKGWSYSDAEAEIPPANFDFFFGANWAAFRRDLEDGGLFAPELGISESRYSSVGEETELQQRLVANGAKPVYLPRATILHPVPAECYTPQWLWCRRFRLGVAEWLTDHAAPHRRRPLFGLPLWVLRSLIERRLEGCRLTLSGAATEARMENMMEEAHLVGMLYGAWTAARKRPQDASRPRAEILAARPQPPIG